MRFMHTTLASGLFLIKVVFEELNLVRISSSL